MTHDAEQRIRDRAYHLWEAAGRPHGRDHEFWEQARKAEHSAVQNGMAEASAAKKSAAKPSRDKASPSKKAAAPAPPAAKPVAKKKSAGLEAAPAKGKTKRGPGAKPAR